MKNFALLVVLLLATPVMQATLPAPMPPIPSRDALLQLLMEAHGVPRLIEQSRQSTLESARQNMQLLNLAKIDIPLIKAECSKKMGQAAESYLASAAKPVPAAEINRIYADIYKDFSDGELQSLIQFYQSPLGVKEKQANPAVPAEFMKAYARLQQLSLEQAAQSLPAAMPENISSCLPPIFKLLGAGK